jgi:hypothetical protein
MLDVCVCVLSHHPIIGMPPCVHMIDHVIIDISAYSHASIDYTIVYCIYLTSQHHLSIYSIHPVCTKLISHVFEYLAGAAYFRFLI